MSRFDRQQLGKPYQVYSEITKQGKTLSGSKVRVTWRFGWTDASSDNREHEIILVHSVISGKKTVTEDGRKVVEVATILQSDFSHGWQSSNYVFRVEIGTHAANDSGGYVFSIDGVRYADMLHKNDVKRYLRDNQHADSHEPTTGRPTVAKATGTTGTAGNNNNRAPFQSPTDSNAVKKVPPITINPAKKEFDPFGGDDDPFSSSAEKEVQTQSAVALLMDFDDDVAVAVAPSGAGSSGFDPFGDSSGQSNDPFGSSSSAISGATNSNHPASATKAHDYSSDFASLSFNDSHSTANTMDPFASVPSSSASRVDPFSNRGDLGSLSPNSALSSSTAAVDPFGDYGSAPPTAPGQSNGQAPKADPAAWLETKLVNLDLTGNGAGAKGGSTMGAPSLGLLLQGSGSTPPLSAMNAPPRPPVMGVGSGHPMGGAMGGAMSGGFGMPGPVGGMGGMGMPPQGGVMGMPQQQQFQQQQQQQQQPMGGFAGRGPVGTSIGMNIQGGGVVNMQGLGAQGMQGMQGGMGGMGAPRPAMSGQQMKPSGYGAVSTGGSAGMTSYKAGSAGPGPGPKSSLDNLDIWK